MAAPRRPWSSRAIPDFGGTIVAGVNVPLFKGHESAIEGRIGIGDVPDFRILLTVGL